MESAESEKEYLNKFFEWFNEQISKDVEELNKALSYDLEISQLCTEEFTKDLPNVTEQ